MDGNGRWASRRNLERIVGHAAGEKPAIATVKTALDLGIRWLTLFAFSTENWTRPQAEVNFIMELHVNLIKRYSDFFHSQNIRVRYMGAMDQIPEPLAVAARRLEYLTAHNHGMTLTLAFNHGGRADLIEIFRRMTLARVTADEINEELVNQYSQYPDMPNLDLVIRTAGEFRISNFMLWQIPYAELVFCNILWPDFTPVDFLNAIDEYHRRARTFGMSATELER
jgi:undecaprenyl diphosphate synthase